MDEILNQIAADPWGRLVLQHIVSGGLKANYLFLLVCARLTGVFLLAPCFSAIGIPLSARIGIVLCLSLVITPALVGVNKDDALISLMSFESVASRSSLQSLSGLGCELLCEMSLGTLLGIGTMTVLSGFRMGGEWLDRQTGLAVGGLLNPEGSPELMQRSSITELLGVVLFLTIKPFGGMLLLLQSLLLSFQSLPLGKAAWFMSLSEILSGLLQQSFVLGLRIAMPLIAAMTLVDIALVFVSRDTPLPMGPINLIIRMSISMLILALTMTVLPEVVVVASSSVFQSLRGVR